MLVQGVGEQLLKVVCTVRVSAVLLFPYRKCEQIKFRRFYAGFISLRHKQKHVQQLVRRCLYQCTFKKMPSELLAQKYNFLFQDAVQKATEDWEQKCNTKVIVKTQ